MPDDFRDYLGDRVSSDFDGYQIWLSTQGGDKIALEPNVFAALLRYQERIKRMLATSPDAVEDGP